MERIGLSVRAIESATRSGARSSPASHIADCIALIACKKFSACAWRARCPPNHTVVWNAELWAVRREDVCAGLRGAHAEIKRRLDGTHWLRFRGRYLPLQPCAAAAIRKSLRPPGLAITNQNQNCSPARDHPWRKPWKRTFVLCIDTRRSHPCQAI
jgi:hypothetical protein